MEGQTTQSYFPSQLISPSIVLRDELETARAIKVDPNLNEKDQDDLLDACKCFEFVENVADSAGGWDEGHIEDDVDIKNEELQDVENSEEDTGVAEDLLIFTEFAEHSNIYVQKCDNQQKDSQIVMNT